jgi:hypothetical protein
MPIKIFYSWQSDQRQNRNFIRSALDAAIKDLRADTSLEEAQRDIFADQGTQDVPGNYGDSALNSGKPLAKPHGIQQ